jgi:hypothetical protein
MKSFSLVVIVLVSLFASAQQIDTLRVMTYNVNNYGFPPTSGCTLQNPMLKHPFLRTVIGYTDPDILGLEKMDASPASFSKDTVISEVLDSVCAGCWGHSSFTDVSGYGKVDMLYFKTSKIGFISTTTIFSADPNVSDINLHKLYYKSPNLATTHDTAFINVILMHDKSGNDPSDSAERSDDVSAAMTWLNSHVTAPGNYIFMGDFNTQTSTEGCFQSVIHSSSAYTSFTDPTDQVGDWSADPAAYADYLTQSTRTTDPGDCAAVDGMTEIYDHILYTAPVMQGSKYLRYLPGSYTVVGQDGHHTGIAIHAPPADPAAPSDVVDALYYMSEHLPVASMLAVTVPGETGISAIDEPALFTCAAIASDHLSVMAMMPADSGAFHSSIYDIQGRLISTNDIYSAQDNLLPTAALSCGQYILTIRDDNGIIFTHRFAKVNM